MSPIGKTSVFVLAVAFASFGCVSAFATLPYNPVPFGSPSLGPNVAPPSTVFGKEYSHDQDHSAVAPGGVPDPERIVAWDGSGGTADGQDFTGTRPFLTPDGQIDATANHADALFTPLLEDRAHLVFSVDDLYTSYVGGQAVLTSLPSAGPILLANGNTIGGAGELSVELAVYGGANPASVQTLWATQSQVNGSPLPDDIDGIELWGPEPGFTADTNKYSLDVDMFSYNVIPNLPNDAVSVWNASGSPYILHSTIVNSVSSLLPTGPAGGIPFDLINLDALMVRDFNGSSDTFDRDPSGGGANDQILFSIRQIPDAAGGYYATGSELFVLDAAGNVNFLFHGGHLWDHAHALANFNVSGPDELGVIDINAIEGVADTVIPEPTGIVMLLAGGLGIALFARRGWK
ncbi:MAG: hypothetical protein GX621_14860 [Pirellulaceae bacterium]|nr:hypothetical protein [Pirellulaceae bacterium]